MFTGLIEEIGTVKAVRASAGGAHITVGASKVLEGIKTGDSITIDGACQTVTGFDSGSFTVFASKITCDITTLGDLKSDSVVNLERALSPGGRMGGHIVQGHVDGTGKIKGIASDSNGMRIEISAPGEILRYIVQKGSVAIDGISLTVVSIGGEVFSLYIIPETMRNTTLLAKKPGMEVNIEVDILAKYVEKMLGKDTAGRDERLKKKLMEEGYM